MGLPSVVPSLLRSSRAIDGRSVCASPHRIGLGLHPVVPALLRGRLSVNAWCGDHPRPSGASSPAASLGRPTGRHSFVPRARTAQSAVSHAPPLPQRPRPLAVRSGKHSGSRVRVPSVCLPRRGEGIRTMARTRRQRRWTDASRGEQLRFIALLVAVVIVVTDIILGGIFPLWVVFLAGFYVFAVGCLVASVVAATLAFR
jgi:hypothetical protein